MRFARTNQVLNKANAIKVFQGCTHYCLYCPSRSHCSSNKSFTKVRVKDNIIPVFEMELRHKRKKIMLSTNLDSDPYQPIEKEVRIFPEIINLIIKNQFGLSLTTKSSLINRDLDLLSNLNRETKVVVNLNLPTLDPIKLKLLEPLSMSVNERIELIDNLTRLKIPVNIQIRPILPFINDNVNEFTDLVKFLISKNINGIYLTSYGVRMRLNSRDFFFKNLENKDKNLSKQYKYYFKNGFIFESPNAKILNDKYLKLIENKDILTDPYEIKKFNRKYANRIKEKQLSFL